MYLTILECGCSELNGDMRGLRGLKPCREEPFLMETAFTQLLM